MSSGLILLTQTGNLVNRLMHPDYKVSKTYEVTLTDELRGNEAVAFSSGCMLLKDSPIPCLPATLLPLYNSNKYIHNSCNKDDGEHHSNSHHITSDSIINNMDEKGRNKEDIMCANSNSNNMCTVLLKEGRYHQIRRMFGSLGHRVTDIKRVAVGDVSLGDLKDGHFTPLTISVSINIDKVLHPCNIISPYQY